MQHLGVVEPRAEHPLDEPLEPLERAVAADGCQAVPAARLPRLADDVQAHGVVRVAELEQDLDELAVAEDHLAANVAVLVDGTGQHRPHEVRPGPDEVACGPTSQVTRSWNVCFMGLNEMKEMK